MRLENQRQNMIVCTLVINDKHENTCAGGYWNNVCAPEWKLSDVSNDAVCMVEVKEEDLVKKRG
jgi:hypothetical protein